jgi:hypothetical protein
VQHPRYKPQVPFEERCQILKIIEYIEGQVWKCTVFDRFPHQIRYASNTASAKVEFLLPWPPRLSIDYLDMFSFIKPTNDAIDHKNEEHNTIYVSLKRIILEERSQIRQENQ